MDTGDMILHSHSTTVDKAIRVVSFLAEHPEGVGVNALCRELDVQKPGLLRILNALTDAGWILKDPESLRYRIGYHLLTLGAQALFGPHFQEVAHQALRRLSADADETANLGVLDHFRVVFIDQMEASHSIRLQVRVGSQAPSHCTGLGKVLLAHLDEKTLNHFLKGAPFESFTDRTRTTRAALAEELERVRTQGYAIDDEEHRVGIRCISAPIYNYSGDAVAALSISGPITRVSDETLPTLIAQVTERAAQVSELLGYRMGQ
jgi:IclR family KDG regulon transcriptional repressor